MANTVCMPMGCQKGKVIDEKDLVLIGYDADGNEIWAPPSGLLKSGLWYAPAIVALPAGTVDVSYSATSEGDVQIQRIAAEQVGMTFWKELNE